jgi:uncharacterized protein YdeI (YjbR/CyaY-like superfamily)
MEIGTTLKITNRKDWRNWLKKNHSSEKEIWLVFYLKESGKPFLPYDEAVEEALCFGWIDSIIKKLEADSRAQRFTPRNPKSNLSELNKERVRRMIKAGKMTPAGLESIKKHLVKNEKGEIEPIPFVMPEDIIKRLKKDPVVWENFQNFPDYYKRIRIGFIDNSRERPEVFEKRLAYFIKMTVENKRFGSLT